MCFFWNLCMFSGEVSVKVFVPYDNWLFIFLLSFKGSLHIWVSSVFCLYDVSFVGIFSQSVACLSISLITKTF